MGGCVGRPRHAPTATGEEENGEVFPVPRLLRCVAFQSPDNGNYLRYTRECEGAAADRLLRLDGESVTSPHTRFYMEPSREHGGHVHVRSCYDNKYWMARQLDNGGGGWVVGTADEADEDLSQPTCTLFKTTAGDPPGSIRFLHAQLGMYMCMSSSSDTTKQTLVFSLHEGHEDLSAYIIHDLSQQVVLPRYLAFKGDNGMYLRPKTQERHEYLQFSGRYLGDQALVNTVHSNNDGTIRIRSNYYGKFWRRSPNWIWADVSADGGGTSSSDANTLFRAIRFGNELVALQNLGNNYYCHRLTTEGKKNCLNAGTPTITAGARLRLEEAVVSREIYDVVLDLSGPRVYGKSVVDMATASALNDTTSNNTAKLTLECRDTEKRTWGSSVMLNLGVTAKICTGVPCIVAGGNVEVAAEFSGSYSWGSSMEKVTANDVVYRVTVPPKTRVTVTLTATKGSCDVPFSYKQSDTLIDGRRETCDMYDGIYTGVNFYDFKCVVSEEKI